MSDVMVCAVVHKPAQEGVHQGASPLGNKILPPPWSSSMSHVLLLCWFLGRCAPVVLLKLFNVPVYASWRSFNVLKRLIPPLSWRFADYLHTLFLLRLHSFLFLSPYKTTLFSALLSEGLLIFTSSRASHSFTTNTLPNWEIRKQFEELARHLVDCFNCVFSWLLQIPPNISTYWIMC